jgi:hypothetical protein
MPARGPGGLFGPVPKLAITLGQLMDDLDGQRLRMGVLRETHPTDRARADHAVTRGIVTAGGAVAVLAGALVQAPPLFAGLSLATLVLWPVGGIALLLAMMGWVPRRG